MKTKGYVTILAVLVLLAVTSGIATTLIFSSTDAVESRESLRQGSQALLFSEACLEEGLLQIIKDPTYSSETFTMPQGDCEIAVENNSGIYIIHATGKNAKFEKSVIAQVNLDAEKLIVLSWREE
ncbi:MAG: hypothetical protein UT50_C0002G0012 [Candidatus Moranbacteria bacterium GW2011_GWA2_39_41]|nr:MAG: hypothetical protein UT50_C0002G0012 [Candidatus Moranbacteria bacterium GW2011_GWA2_39_41]